MRKAIDQVCVATLVEGPPTKLKRKLVHLKTPTKPNKVGFWGDIFEAPWVGGNKVNGLMGLAQWKSGLNAPEFPTPEEVDKRVPSVSVDVQRLFGISPLDSIPSNTGRSSTDNDTRSRAEADQSSANTYDKSGHKDQLRNPIQSTWMGHASFLVQCSGVNILTDPVWVDRASPVQFAGPKRYVQPPMQIEDMPPIHVVTISHNHYDHLCAATVMRLHKAFDPVFVVPLGMKQRWFVTNFGSRWPKESLAKVVELNWWEEVPCKFAVTTSSQSSDTSTDSPIVNPSHTDTLSSCVTITSTPVQHWTTRTSFDRNKELWCGFVYTFETTASNKTDILPTRLAYHAGDTAYCPMFLETALEFCGKPSTDTEPTAPIPADGKETIQHTPNEGIDPAQQTRFDLAMIPIGAYHPRWFLSVQHVDPKEAVQIHLDLNRPRLSLGMHWGTWILTDEPIDEPPQLLKVEGEKAGLDKGEFVALKHGESVRI